jgi:hypothetical protein
MMSGKDKQSDDIDMSATKALCCHMKGFIVWIMTGVNAAYHVP